MEALSPIVKVVCSVKEWAGREFIAPTDFSLKPSNDSASMQPETVAISRDDLTGKKPFSW